MAIPLQVAPLELQKSVAMVGYKQVAPLELKRHAEHRAESRAVRRAESVVQEAMILRSVSCVISRGASLKTVRTWKEFLLPDSGWKFLLLTIGINDTV